MIYHCPKCGQDDGLYEFVMISGWIGLNAELEPDGKRECDWHKTEQTGEIGCSCGWNGFKDQLTRLGLDGKPLQQVHPEQVSIEDLL